MREEERFTRGEYATSNDFRRIFDENMNSLYLLAYLLTADHAKAEQCFVSGLQGAVDGNPVFKEWARSWARRAIIRKAVRLVESSPDTGSDRSRPASRDSGYRALVAQREAEVSAVLGLQPFERIVYVTTVLEHYSDHECSLLLDCARRDVLPARTHALEQIARQVEMHVPQNLSAQDPVYDPSRSLIELMGVTPSATSA